MRNVDVHACETDQALSALHRRLHYADRQAERAHVARLSADDQELRFGCMQSADALRRHVYSLDFDRQVIVGLEAMNGKVIGLGQLIPIDPAGSVGAEVAFSVDADVRGSGLGHYLMKLAVHAACARCMPRLVAQVFRHNAPMLAILRKAGIRFVRADGDMLGSLDLEDPELRTVPTGVTA